MLISHSSLLIYERCIRPVYDLTQQIIGLVYGKDILLLQHFPVMPVKVIGHSKSVYLSFEGMRSIIDLEARIEHLEKGIHSSCHPAGNQWFKMPVLLCEPCRRIKGLPSERFGRRLYCNRSISPRKLPEILGHEA